MSHTQAHTESLDEILAKKRAEGTRGIRLFINPKSRAFEKTIERSFQAMIRADAAGSYEDISDSLL
jgi:hypothetical protein